MTTLPNGTKVRVRNNNGAIGVIRGYCMHYVVEFGIHDTPRGLYLHSCSGQVSSGRGRFMYENEFEVVRNELEEKIAAYIEKELRDGH